MKSPGEIQAFLDGAPYSTEAIYRCPLRVLRERVAHCFDGALFAAAMLRRLGHAPLIVDLLPNDRDDDHLLALYKRDRHWGAVAKSNFVGLRFREPVFRTLRELVMSYFEHYYNVAGEKTLRGCTVPLNLKAFDRLGWMSRDEPLEAIAARLDQIRRVSVVTEAMAAGLLPVDRRSYDAGMLGVDEAGLYRPAGGAGR
ncbi:MAG: hypothetical protein HY812_17455 [Planctomycetes bacterium]|nr:hypothetical protein [Planctomycetota bacterium]